MYNFKVHRAHKDPYYVTTVLFHCEMYPDTKPNLEPYRWLISKDCLHDLMTNYKHIAVNKNGTYYIYGIACIIDNDNDDRVDLLRMDNDELTVTEITDDVPFISPIKLADYKPLY